MGSVSLFFWCLFRTCLAREAPIIFFLVVGLRSEGIECITNAPVFTIDEIENGSCPFKSSITCILIFLNFLFRSPFSILFTATDRSCLPLPNFVAPAIPRLAGPPHLKPSRVHPLSSLPYPSSELLTGTLHRSMCLLGRSTLSNCATSGAFSICRGSSALGITVSQTPTSPSLPQMTGSFPIWSCQATNVPCTCMFSTE
ncbi:hypothetical protein BKA64DRAFT_123196 [Cadophora sp. MPI-SDFR-AT-0126]|nr:hypothetical protein BKA64DRAFT_123196 [Leotiomycetes sp. MPI-SDFR-AT-0126]